MIRLLKTSACDAYAKQLLGLVAGKGLDRSYPGRIRNALVRSKNQKPKQHTENSHAHAQ